MDKLETLNPIKISHGKYVKPKRNTNLLIWDFSGVVGVQE